MRVKRERYLLIVHDGAIAEHLPSNILIAQHACSTYTPKHTLRRTVLHSLIDL